MESITSNVLPKELLPSVELRHQLSPINEAAEGSYRREHPPFVINRKCSKMLANNGNCYVYVTPSSTTSTATTTQNCSVTNTAVAAASMTSSSTSSIECVHTMKKKEMCEELAKYGFEVSEKNSNRNSNSYNISNNYSLFKRKGPITRTTTLIPKGATIQPALRLSHHRKYKSKNNKNCCLLSTTIAVAVIRQIIAPLTTTTKEGISATNKTPPSTAKSRNKITHTKFRLLPTLGATSFLTLLTLICLETVLLSTMSNCAKTFYMHWNTSNSIFRIDNTDHIIDVNKGNLAFEFDQVHIICPVYEPGTYENETEKYIIYNVSKVEYETCRITNADPRVIAICDKPQKLMFFTITFRPFTPQPGGLEFLPGNDYYFISTSSKDDLYRRIGGRCSTNNMKVVFKVCCAPEEKNKTTIATNIGGGTNDNIGVGSGGNMDSPETPTNINQHGHMNNINTIGINGVNTGMIPNVGLGGGGIGNGVNINNNHGGVHQIKPSTNVGTSINTNIEQFNRIPLQPNVIGNNIGGAGGVGLGSHGVSGIMLTPGGGHGGINILAPNRGVGGGVSIAQYPGQHHHGQTGIRINNVPTQQHYPTHKSNNNNNNNNNDDHYDKHPNEVVKNEELTYNSAATSTLLGKGGSYVVDWNWLVAVTTTTISTFTSSTFTKVTLTTVSGGLDKLNDEKLRLDLSKLHLNSEMFATCKCLIVNINPMIWLTILLIIITHYYFNCTYITYNTSTTKKSSKSLAPLTNSYMTTKQR